MAAEERCGILALPQGSTSPGLSIKFVIRCETFKNCHPEPLFGEGPPAYVSDLNALNWLFSEDSRGNAAIRRRDVNISRRSFAKGGSG